MSTGRRVLALLLACGATAGAPAPPAVADPPAVNDCTTHLRLTRHYTVAELQHALNTMSASIREYTNCADVLQQALSAELASRSVNGGAAGSGGSFLPLPLLLALVAIVLAGAGSGVALARRGRRG